MRLDDIEEESAPRVEQYLSKIRALRQIAHKIIDFLAQIEDFQKRLWLKKKFVVETNYCVTLDRVPEKLYPEIAANDAQRQEWVDSFAIDRVEASLSVPGYSVPLSPEFLKGNQNLMIDTVHFSQEFVEKLISQTNDMDKMLDGVCIHSENFQSLRMLQPRYESQICCVYIDPPYNTDATPILYKNGYKSSTWVSLIQDRLLVSRSLLVSDGILIAAIDDEEQVELSFVLADTFNGNELGTICVRSNPSGRPTKTGYSVSHEYLLFAGRSARSGIGRLPPTEDQMARFNQRDEDGVFEWRNLRREGSNSDRSARRGLYYPIFLLEKKIRIPEMHWEENTEEWKLDEEPQQGESVVYPDNEAGDQKTWRWEHPTVTASLDQLAVRKDRSGRDYVYNKRRPHKEGVVSVSSWFEAKYSATEHGTALLKTCSVGHPLVIRSQSMQ